MAILVDTSIWVDHFRRRNAELVQLLAEDRVWCHPLVIGEMACGTPPQRERTLAELGLLRQARAATLDELMAFIDKHNLAGQGCGYVDLSLLAATRLKPGLRLWTLDRRLATLAARLELAHFAASA
jgi:predicted nucleic acid-binding protein